MQLSLSCPDEVSCNLVTSKQKDCLLPIYSGGKGKEKLSSRKGENEKHTAAICINNTDPIPLGKNEESILFR